MNKIVFFCIVIFTSFEVFAEERVVSASAFATEIISEIGMEAELVAVDLTSVYPEKVTNLPNIGYKRALTAEGILSLKPTVLIVDSSSGPKYVIDAVKSSGVQILEIKEPVSVDEITKNIVIIADYFNKDAKKLLEKTVDLHTEMLTQMNKKQRNILFILRHGGGAEFGAGNNTIQNTIINLIGGTNVLQYKGMKPLNLEVMISLMPEYIVYATLEKLNNGERQKIESQVGFRKSKVIFVQSIPLFSFGIASLEEILKLSKQI